MATQHSRSAARLMMAPAVVLLLGWMLVPLTMTLYFSFRKYLPLRGGDLGWVGFDNYVRFVSSSAFWPSVQATLVIVGGVLFNGLLAHRWGLFGAEPLVWLTEASTQSIILIVSWQWLPFATLILLTAIQSLDSEQLEAAEMDGASPVKRFGFITLPHLSRAITVVVLIQTIFLLSIFAEIFVTTQGAFGTKTLTYLIFQRVLESQNIGLGSAGGVYAIILANIVAIFLMRMVGKNLDA
jgi:sorbitol/mannitol transport system permease protein